MFLPFNQGNDGHEGNPPSGTGSSTNYLWREILARPTFMRILKDFALFEPSKSGKKDDGRLVFPRFHQLRAVERVVADIETNGTGKRYLIWHSAGSGKTKTIAWLSHRLIRHMSADSQVDLRLGHRRHRPHGARREHPRRHEPGAVEQGPRRRRRARSPGRSRRN